jgi:glycogen(starch) synthase
MEVVADTQPRRVLITGDTIGGVWHFTLELAQGLLDQGVDVCLATFGQAATVAQRKDVRAIKGLKWRDSSFKLEWMNNPWADIALAGRWLMDLQKSFQPDLVHLNTLCHGDLQWQAPVVTTVHSCVPSWWRAVKSEPLPAQWNRYIEEVKRSLLSVDMVIAPSYAALSTVGRNYNIDLTSARAIPNARVASKFVAGTKERFILAAGRLWDEGKNIKALAAVAPDLSWPVYLAGESQDPNGKDDFVLTGGGCHLLGELSSSDLATWYARASIYALPARYEPFGLSALEAALSGCALVLGDIDSLREIWKDAAVFVPASDPVALERALNRLISSPSALAQMARKATSRARQYTRSRMVSEYLAAYDCALRQEKGRRHACAS